MYLTPAKPFFLSDGIDPFSALLRSASVEQFNPPEEILAGRSEMAPSDYR